MMSSSDYSVDFADKDDLKEIENYDDFGFPETWVDNMRELGYNKPAGLQMDILNLMHKKVSIVGNVPVNSGGEHAVLGYSVGACHKAREEGSYKPEEFHPFAVFIVGNEAMMEKFQAIAKDLAKGLDINVVSRSIAGFDSERECEIAFQKCDIAILTADGFHRYLMDDLVILTQVKIFGIQNLDWKKDVERMDRFKTACKSTEFPKVGDRIIIFFDDFYITVAEDILAKDAKAIITFGNGEQQRSAARHKSGEQPKAARPKFISDAPSESRFIQGSVMARPAFLIESDAEYARNCSDAEKDDLKRAARGDPKYIFEVVPKQDRTAALVKRLQTLLEECGGNKMKFPRTVIYVKTALEGHSLYGQLVRNVNDKTLILDCSKLTANVESQLELFDSGSYRILIIYKKNPDIVFMKVDNYIFMDCTGDLEYMAQMSEADDKPLTVMSFCAHKDVGKLQKIRKSLEKHNLPVDDIDALIKDLTPSYQEDSGNSSDDDY